MFAEPVMRRRTALRLAVGAAALPLVSIASRAQSAKPFVARLSHNKNPEEQFHVVMSKVAERIAARTSGRLQLKVFPAAQLGDELPAAEAVSTGSIEMALVSAAGAGTFLPPFGAFIAPYAFKDWAEVRRVVDGPLGQSLDQQLIAARDLQVMEYFYDGLREMITRSKPVHTVADMQGLKMRVPPNKLFRETFRAFGAAPTPMTFSELYTGLQQGVVDGADFVVPLVVTSKVYEVIKTVSITDHMITTLVLLVSPSWLARLPDDLKTVLREEMRAGSDEAMRLISAGETTGQDDLRRLGITVVTDVDIAGFRKAAAAVPVAMAADWGPDFWSKLQAAKDA